MLPWLRGRTLNVSIALATVGLVSFLSASITGTSWVVGSDRVLAAFDEQGAERLHRLPDPVEVRVHLQRALEVRQRAIGLVELEMDHAVAAERAEVKGI